MKIILSLLVLSGAAFGHTAESDLEKEIARFGCSVTAQGKVLYDYKGSYRKFDAKLSGIGATCTELSVGGTSNKIDRLSVKVHKSGRNEVTMLFNNPPAVGQGEAVLLEGTVVRFDKEATYYGDIYQRHIDEGACTETGWHAKRDCWKHRGGFYFTTK